MTTVVFPAPQEIMRRIIVPSEQGGWSLAGEPIVIALALAPRASGVLLALATLMAFLARQPMKIFLSDLYRGRLFVRSKVALGTAVVFLLLGVTALAAVVSIAGTAVLWPILFAFPFAAVQIAHDAANESRGAIPEVCGAIAIASVVAMAGLATGQLQLAYVLWGFAALKSAGAVLYVRARLRAERERRGQAIRGTAGAVLAVSAHLFALVLASYAWWSGHTTIALVLAFALLLSRAVHGLSRFSAAMSAKAIGVREVAYGVIFVVLVVAGQW